MTLLIEALPYLCALLATIAGVLGGMLLEDELHLIASFRLARSLRGERHYRA